MLDVVSKSVVVLAVVVLVLSAPWWLSVPIGTWSYLDEWRDGAPEGSIDISRKRYFFPREIHTNGLPLPGGDFGFLDDPHYFATKPDRLEVEDARGRNVELTVQGFDVNYGFEKPKNVEHVLAVAFNGRVAEYDVSPLFFQHVLGDVHVIGWRAGQMVVYVANVYFAASDTSWNNVFVLVEWGEDGPGARAQVVLEDDAAIWQEVFEDLSSDPDPALDRLCLAKNKTAIEFKERVSGVPCPNG